MILDNICDKRKEQLERDISKVSRQDIKAMAAEKEYQTVSFSKSIKRDTLSVISEVKKASPSKPPASMRKAVRMQFPVLLRNIIFKALGNISKL